MSKCLSERSENRNLWHMVVKLKTFIISPEIYYSELRNVVKFFFFFLYSDLLLYSSKFAKTETSVGSSKMAEISAPSCLGHLKFAHEKSKRKQAHINLINLYRRDGELFKSKTGLFHIIWSSRKAFENHQYFKIQMLHFVTNF